MECLQLRVQDVDLARSEITVRDGKGGEDRLTMLPVSLRVPLAQHLAVAVDLSPGAALAESEHGGAGPAPCG